MTGAPSTDRSLSAEFFELVYADADLVRAEFADLVDAGWETSRPDDGGDESPGSGAVGGNRGRHPLARSRPLSGNVSTGHAVDGRGSWRRERSPPGSGGPHRRHSHD